MKVYKRRAPAAPDAPAPGATVVEHTEPDAPAESDTLPKAKRSQPRDTSPTNNHWCVRKLW